MDDPTTYPRIYRYGWGWGTFNVIFGLVVFGLGGSFYFLFPVHDIVSRGLLFFFESLAILLGAYCVISVFRSYLILYEDRLEYQGVYRKHIIKRDNIRTITPPLSLWGTTALNVLLLNPDRQYITLIDYGRKDESFLKWFDGMPREHLPADH